ncbi:hypothetical protein P4J00_23780 [Bacillus cereus]|nr:hypothetical protein [Bacillus cereus]
MQINYLLAGIYGEEAARHIFESMCGALIYEEIADKKGSLALDSFTTDLKNQKEEVRVYPISSGKVLAVRTTQGDGGLDIIYEVDNNWIVYQCKFFKDSPIDNASRKEQIENSFNTALKTAKKYGKSIVEWVLCVPLDLSNDEREGFWNSFVTNYQKDVNIIRPMLNSEISSLLMKHIHIYNHYFMSINPTLKNFSRKKMYDSLKEFNKKIRAATSILAIPNLNEQLPSLLKITDEYKILFDTYDSIFRLYKNRMRELFIEMDENSIKTQELKKESQLWKDSDIKNIPERTIKMQEYYNSAIDEKIDELGILKTEILTIITYLESSEESFIE